jgi:hypothetical protein
MDVHDHIFIPLEGSDGRRGHVFGLSECPKEGSRLTLTYDGREYDDYEVTFSGRISRRWRRAGFPGPYDALVVRDSENL